MASKAVAEALPDAADVAEGMQELEEREAEKQEWLESPQAQQEREQSQTAYSDSSPVQAAELLEGQFAEQLAVIEQDPARVISDAKVDQVLGPTGAQITVGGDTMLVEGTMPVKVHDAEGDLSKVDLNLVGSGNGFAPANPITEVSLPLQASEGVAIGESGLAVTPALADGDSVAQRFGDKDLLYPETQTDTSLLASPLSSGVEFSSELLSEQSPEELRFDLTLPPSSELRSDGSGGTEVSEEGTQIARIPAPTAVDAQGSSVPVTMRVEESSIVLDVEHRGGQFAYPLLVDPAIQENWYDGNNWWWGQNLWALEPGTSPWIWGTNDGGRFWAGTHHIYRQWNGSDRGLFISGTDTSGAQPADHIGQFTYTAPGGSDSFIPAALISPLWRDDHGCTDLGKYPEPHDYTGLWSDTYGWASFHRDWAHTYGYGIEQPETQLPPQEMWKKNTGRVLIIGMGTGSGAAKIPCWRDIYAGGVAVFLDDWYAPALSSVTGVPSGWVNGTTPFTINVSEVDTGLGVRYITIAPSGTAIIQDQVGCSGLFNSRCPGTESHAFNLNGLSFDQGQKPATITAEDPTGKVSGAYTFETKVDRSPPEVELSGQLAKQTGEEVIFGEGEKPQSAGKDKLSLPVYNLKIKARDGNSAGNASNAEKRSGVKSIEVFLDGKTTAEQTWTQACPASSCEMTQTYTLKLQDLSAGQHTLKVITSDQVNEKLERDIQFEYFPATGMKDEYVMQRFPLPNGQGNEAEEESPDRPELAVNVTNGNLVYREKDVEVDGYGANLEVERYYNSMLPTAQNTEWGDGWTLAQTPELDPEEGAAPKEASLRDTSGAVKGDVKLPTETGKTQFDPVLRATVTKEAGGGYELADESGETDNKIAFDASGRTKELRTEGYAKVDYSYSAGKLDEIAVKDPASASDLSEAEEEAFDYVPPAPSYKSVFGVVGSGDGQLAKPVDIALAPNGDLFVLDRSLNRVQRFNQEGKYLSKFGTEGTANGQFKAPTSIAIDASGNLYVADTNNSRIQKFNEKGEFLKAFGSLGTANGQFKAPEGVAVDQKGNVLVADTGNSRIQKFNANGEFLSKFGSAGTGNGQFTQANSLDVGPGGKIWVSDKGINRITQFNEAGEFVQKFGSAGAGDGQFTNPDGIEVDSRGNVFVIDEGNGRVEQFSQAGKYLAKFGSKGFGTGQFNFTSTGFPIGMAVDNKGGLWVSDEMNTRIQKWSVPSYRPSWYGSFATLGSGDGQLKTPGDIAITQTGDVWVVDRGNNRIEKFNQEGLYVSKFGSTGSGNGQFNRPTSIAIDASGNLWITDAGNNRIQNFSESGEFIKAVGSAGTGNAQFSSPEGIATDFKGNVYVADTYNKRIQKFNEAGEFLSKFGSAGSGPGQFTEANAIDIGRSGKIWVADWGANRIEQFNEAGEFAQQFGSSGTGDGQFSHPDAIEADSKGNIWVGDQSNGRVELFNEAGEYVTQFGAKGSGEGQFSFTYPMGIVADASGGLWITDVNNNRIQKWQIPNTEPTKVPEENDPSVDVKLSAGLVSSVEGAQAGTNTYTHVGDDLTAHKGSLGETKYTYDASGRMTKVELPNGNKASITYNQTYGRVSSVAVTIAGVTKTTYFTYTDEPSRRTEVTPPNAPIVTYDIGEDGSVLRWWNTPKPPTISLAGSLYANKETSTPITTGDHTLEVAAYSAEGISSIQVIANGNQLAKEKTCSQDPEKPGTECVNELTEWVTNTLNHAPGILNLEVIVTDRTGAMEGKRFWVNIPPPPPPPAPGSPVPPTFEGVQHFREEFGLEVWDPVSNELELNDRIFDLISAWWGGDQVARATMDRWGEPLRSADVAELEYRENYVRVDGPLIKQWAEANAPGSYAGYYVDERAGGMIYVGFVSNQSEQVAALKAATNLMAAGRVTAFPQLPSRSLAGLEALQSSIASANVSGVTRIGIDMKNNTVTVGASNVSQVQTALSSQFSSQMNSIAIYYAPHQLVPKSRERNSGEVRAGDVYFGPIGGCTSGFGAWDVGAIKSNGQVLYRFFVLTVAHCIYSGEKAYRRDHPDLPGNPSHVVELGEATRMGWYHESSDWGTDASAIRVEGDIAPRSIYRAPLPSRDVSGMALPPPGVHLCVSGRTSDKLECGPMFSGVEWVQYEGQKMWQPCFKALALGGDSGGPVFIQGTGIAVGLLSAGSNEKEPDGSYVKEACFTPLLPIPGRESTGPGILGAPGMNLNLLTR